MNVPEQVWAPELPAHRANLLLRADLGSGRKVKALEIQLNGYP